MPATESLVRRLFAMPTVVVILIWLTSALAFTQSETVLYTFQLGTDATSPQSSLVADGKGNLYGAGDTGGSGSCNGIVGNCGAIFRLSPPTASGGSWTEAVIYNFGSNANDGYFPADGLIFDQQGNLYGTTVLGGSGTCAGGCGTVFELSPPSTSGGPWTETILHNFHGGAGDGANPFARLVFDAQGNLYGTTKGGGSGFCSGYPGLCGTVFRLSPPVRKGGSWKNRILHSFGNGYDGISPVSPLLVDDAGVLLGTTSQGGAQACGSGGFQNGCGVVFQLTPPPTASGQWTEILYKIPSQQRGAFIYGGLARAHNGKLYAAAVAGGTGQCMDELGFTVGCGVVFELTPPAPGSHNWHASTIYNFTGLGDGAEPMSSLVVDKSGNIYGSAVAGGGLGVCPPGIIHVRTCGTVFRLTPPTSSGGAWTETTVHAFAGGTDGAMPYGSVILDKDVIYGTTFGGGGCNNFGGCGTVFEIFP